MAPLRDLLLTQVNILILIFQFCFLYNFPITTNPLNLSDGTKKGKAWNIKKLVTLTSFDVMIEYFVCF